MRPAGRLLRASVLVAALALTSLGAPASAQEAASPDADASPAPATTPTPGEATALELRRLVPAEVAGLALTSATFAAEDILANVSSDALLFTLADIAEAHGAELNRFAIAGGGGSGGEGEAFVSVIGGSIPGVPAAALMEAFVEVVLGATDPQLTTAGQVAGHDVTVITARTDAGAADTAYVLLAGEVVWVVIADPGSLDAAIEALAPDAS